MLSLVKFINEKKNPYTDTFHKKDSALKKKNLVGIDEAAKMPGRIENTKISDIRYILPETGHNTFNR